MSRLLSCLSAVISTVSAEAIRYDLDGNGI